MAMACNNDLMVGCLRGPRIRIRPPFVRVDY
jgi:hypothetical protein